jgi:hypothetical protein
MPTLSSLHVYPLKSASGIAPDEADVERRGLDGDRRWMLVDGEGTFLSQRSHPRLALIDVAATDQGLRLAAPDQPPIDVPRPNGSEATRPVTVWGDDVDAALATDAAHAWCSEFLGADVQLVFMPDASRRAVDADYAVRDNDIVSFADGYPLLLTTTASLADLNDRLSGEALPMDRFRPNVVIDGTDPWAEDAWRRVRIGNVVFRSVKPCGRCAVTTTDQQTAARGTEPLTTLATFRRGADTGKVYFGWNLIPEAPGRLRVGDDMDVLERRTPPRFGGA